MEREVQKAMVLMEGAEGEVLRKKGVSRKVRCYSDRGNNDRGNNRRAVKGWVEVAREEVVAGGGTAEGKQ